MSTSNSRSTDYISLGTVKNTVVDILRVAYRFLDFIFLAIRKNIWIILFCLALGLGLAYLYTRLKARYYETEMIVMQNDLPRKTYAEVIYNLNSLLASRSYNDLAQELKISQSEASAILSLEAYSLTNESLEKDTATRLGQQLKIRAKLQDNALIPKLQTALISYLNNNTYAKQVRESQKLVYHQKLAFIEEEQRRLDSLKDNYNRSLASMRLPTTFYNSGLNPAEIYQHSLDLATQKQFIVRWLNLEANGVLLIDGMKKQQNPVSFSQTKILLTGLASGLALGLVLALLATLRTWLNQREKS